MATKISLSTASIPPCKPNTAASTSTNATSSQKSKRSTSKDTSKAQTAHTALTSVPVIEPELLNSLNTNPESPEKLSLPSTSEDTVLSCDMNLAINDPEAAAIQSVINSFSPSVNKIGIDSPKIVERPNFYQPSQNSSQNSNTNSNNNQNGPVGNYVSNFNHLPGQNTIAQHPQVVTTSKTSAPLKRNRENQGNLARVKDHLKKMKFNDPVKSKKSERDRDRDRDRVFHLESQNSNQIRDHNNIDIISPSIPKLEHNISASITHGLIPGTNQRQLVLPTLPPSVSDENDIIDPSLEFEGLSETGTVSENNININQNMPFLVRTHHNSRGSSSLLHTSNLSSGLSDTSPQTNGILNGHNPIHISPSIMREGRETHHSPSGQGVNILSHQGQNLRAFFSVFYDLLLCPETCLDMRRERSIDEKPFRIPPKHPSPPSPPGRTWKSSYHPSQPLTIRTQQPKHH